MHSLSEGSFQNKAAQIPRLDSLITPVKCEYDCCPSNWIGPELN